jgi:hypothetical protein
MLAARTALFCHSMTCLTPQAIPEPEVDLDHLAYALLPLLQNQLAGYIRSLHERIVLQTDNVHIQPPIRCSQLEAGCGVAV